MEGTQLSLNPDWVSHRKLCKYCSKPILSGGFCSEECFAKWQEQQWEQQRYSSDRPDKLVRAIRKCRKMKRWRLAVLKRDNYTCQKCGCKDKHKLHVHHKTSILEIIKKYDFRTKLDIIKCEELWNMENGITLCEWCHVGPYSEHAFRQRFYSRYCRY